MSWPKISIVTPSFNQGPFLEATIRSILDQNYPNLEYLIIDGSSTDGSVDIIRKYADRLAYWVSEKDGGHYDAVNKGFARSTGDIMAWLNADDMYLPTTFGTVASIMTELPQVNWLTTLSQLTWDARGYPQRVNISPGFCRESFLDGTHLPTHKSMWWVQQESTFWRRELWTRAGGRIRTEFRYAGDFDLWARFYQHDELYSTASLLGGFRSRDGQRSQDQQQYQEEARRALDELRKFAGWSRRSIGYWLNRGRLTDIPLLRIYLRKLGKYVSHEVQPTDPRSTASGWRVVRQPFP